MWEEVLWAEVAASTKKQNNLTWLELRVEKWGLRGKGQ